MRNHSKIHTRINTPWLIRHRLSAIGRTAERTVRGVVSRERQKFLPVAAMHPHLPAANRCVVSPSAEGSS